LTKPVQVRKRLVIFIQGYDPRGRAEYFRMFQREFASTCDLYGLTGEIGDTDDDAKRFTTTWNITTNGDGWQVDTRYMLLRWDDIISEDLIRPVWWKIVQMYRTIGVAILNGAFRRMLRADWRFGLFAFLPLVLITVWILLGSFIGVLCMSLVATLGAPEIVSRIVGAVTGVGGFASLLWLTEPITMLLHRCDEAATTDQLINRKRKDIEQRMDMFARSVVDAVTASKADEVVIVGHSFGSVLAMEVLGRALVRKPELGEDGPCVALLTLGANLPVVGFDPEAKWFRNRLRQLAVAPDIDWVDYQSRDDVLNFCPFDPVAGHDIVLEDDERRNPTMVAISFRDLWKLGSFGLRRWRFFRAHSQFLLANERLGAAYDNYLICCGPVDLMTRATKPQQAIAAIGAKNRPDMGPAAGH
jgi:pimeloyl-ACP methyl ester carboxylesterase